MNLRQRAYIKLTDAAPPAVATRMDLLQPSALAGPALNGQRERQRIIRELARAIEFEAVVETGTFRAATTLFLSHAIGCPVHSVELLRRHFRYSQIRCAEEPNIHLYQGDSRRFLSKQASAIGRRTTLFYLDAHWQADVPRFEELEIIAAGWSRAIVIIDDFAVHDDPGYGFAKYGDTPLTVDYLPPLPGWHRFFPAAPAVQETGARRGCIVLASPDLAGSFDDVSTLRKVGVGLEGEPN